MYFHAHIRQQKYSQVIFYCRMWEWVCSRDRRGKEVSSEQNSHNRQLGVARQ